MHELYLCPASLRASLGLMLRIPGTAGSRRCPKWWHPHLRCTVRQPDHWSGLSTKLGTPLTGVSHRRLPADPWLNHLVWLPLGIGCLRRHHWSNRLSPISGVAWSSCTDTSFAGLCPSPSSAVCSSFLFIPLSAPMSSPLLRRSAWHQRFPVRFFGFALCVAAVAPPVGSIDLLARH